MKKILLIISVLLLTGCNVKYNLVIKDNEEVNEKIVIYVNNEDIANTNMGVDEFLDYYSHLYEQNEGYEKFNINTKKSSDYSQFIVERNYKNLDEYISSYSFKYMFNDASVERVGNYINFTTSNNLKLEEINSNIEISDFLCDDYELSIKFYNEVVRHNADKVDEKNNIYTWYVNKNSVKDHIEFKIGPKVRYDVMIFDYIQNNYLIIGAVSFILIAMIVCGLYIVIKAKKNNEI